MTVYIIVKTVNEPIDNWRIMWVMVNKAKAESTLKMCQEHNNNSEYASFKLVEQELDEE